VAERVVTVLSKVGYTPGGPPQNISLFSRGYGKIPFRLDHFFETPLSCFDYQGVVKTLEFSATAFDQSGYPPKVHGTSVYTLGTG
jgi:hypothetical protein